MFLETDEGGSPFVHLNKLDNGGELGEVEERVLCTYTMRWTGTENGSRTASPLRPVNVPVSSCFDCEDAVCCNQRVTVEKRYTIVVNQRPTLSSKMKRTAVPVGSK